MTRPRALRLREGARERIFAYALLTPAALAVAALVIYPLFRVVSISTRIGRTMNFARIGLLPAGTGNYTRILADPAFWHAVEVTAIYIAGSVAVAFVIGLGTALVLNEAFPARRAFRTLLLLPWAVPGVVASVVFRWMFDGSFGVVNAILRHTGLYGGDIAWFADGSTALAAVTVPTVWKAYPLITLTLLAAMQTIPAELYEASAVDGATARERFAHITWPGISAAAILAALVSALWIFRDIDIIYAATGGGPDRATETLALYVYNEAFQFFRIGTAAAVGVLMVVAALIASGVSLAAAGKERL